jgi:hypothetical protein
LPPVALTFPPEPGFDEDPEEHAIAPTSNREIDRVFIVLDSYRKKPTL